MRLMAPPDGEHEQRFARIEERIVDLDRRVSEAVKESNGRFEEVNRRITDFKAETNKRFDRVEGDLKDLKKGVESIQTTLARVGVGVAVTFASVLITKGV